MVTVDNIIQQKTRTTREYCSYYTDSDPILSYMVSNLDISEKDMILEPCAGDGVFIRKILDLFPRQDYSIEALDLNPIAISNLSQKFKEKNIEVRKADTLLDTTLDFYRNMGGGYTKIIGNPPYGAWQEYDKRRVLKKRYGGNVKETYTLFIRRAIDLLKENGKLVFIVPDTFLALHLHKGTRKKILTEVRVDELLMFPSKFFPGVNFGYSNLCVISVTKTTNIGSHKIKIVKVNKEVNSLYDIARKDYSLADEVEEVSQEKVLNSLDYSFFVGGDTKLRSLINECKLTLGDLAYCVTGFCSGSNTEFYKPLCNDQKAIKDYTTIDVSKVNFDFKLVPDILNGLGLNDGKSYIPILKGGKGTFIKESDWFVLWDRKTVEFYRKNKKSRFQNSQFYFKQGIGVPMVKGSRIRAFFLEHRLFDQSIVGIFPREEKHLYYLIAFLNSDVCNRILKVINHTANNSANYLKKIPIIIDKKYFDDICNSVVDFMKNGDLATVLKKINVMFNTIYNEC